MITETNNQLIFNVPIISNQGSPIRVVTNNYTAALNDSVILVDAPINVVVTLPAISTVSNKLYTIKRLMSGTNYLNIVANGSELIDEFGTNQLLQKYHTVTLQNNGSTWYILGEVK